MSRKTINPHRYKMYIFDGDNRAFVAYAKSYEEAVVLIEDKVLKTYINDAARDSARRLLNKPDALTVIDEKYATEFNWGVTWIPALY